MFFNITNHPISTWPEEEIEMAENLGGDLLQIGFPEILPEDDDDVIDRKIKDVIDVVMGFLTHEDYALVAGDFTTTFILVQRLKNLGVICVASNSKREAVEEPQPDGSVKFTHTFRFCGFRQYRWAN